MPRGTQLTEFEKGQIQAYIDEGLTDAAISEKIGRSRKVVGNFRRLGQKYGSKNRSGRPRKLTKRDERRVFDLLNREKMTCGQVRSALGGNVSKMTIWRTANENPDLVYRKRLGKPKLSANHKLARLKFASDYIDYGPKWKKVVFSDEKRFNLDGPDGLQYYWHDLRKEPESFSKRQCGGGGIMVWGAVSFGGNTDIVFVEQTMNSLCYQKVLEDNLLPVIEQICGNDGIFQQDNAPVHNSRSTKQWFTSKNLQVLPWPSRSPDLNPIENVWGLLSRAVYRQGRQFNCKADLKNAIRTEWSKLDQSKIRSLVTSMKNRLIEVIAKKGGHTSY